MIELLLVFALGFVVGALVVYFYPEEEHVAQTVEDLVLEEAQRLVAHVEESFKDMSGEFKRNQVLRALQNIFPNRKTNDLALAIELAVRK